MEVMWSILLLCSFLFLQHSASAQVCKISNIQIDSEDGRQQYIELNLKKVDVDEEGSCPGCNLSEDSKARAYQYSQWTATPPTFNLVFTPGEIILECDSSDGYSPLPFGLCSKSASSKEGTCGSSSCELNDVEDLAEVIEEKNLIPLRTGDEKLDHRIARAIVLLNIGNVDKAIDEFTAVIESEPGAAVAYFGRGAAYARQGLQHPLVARRALADFNKAIQLDTGGSRPDIYVHRAEVLMMLQHFHDAYNDATTALKVKPMPKIYFLRGVISLLLENFSDAENDFRKNLQCSDEKIQSLSHFHLGLALYYRGKVRNAIEVFKEVLKQNPNHLEASLSLAQGFKELGNIKAALAKFNTTLNLQANYSMVYQLRGNMIFQNGDPASAILDFQKCLEVDSTSAGCQYMKGAANVMQGRFYEGLKDTTKLMVSSAPVIKASPEYIKAHYLREYARYLHSRLDTPITSIQPDADFSPEYLDHWVKLKPFDFKNYKEQPGLQPDVGDVQPLKEIPPHLEPLLCRAEALGRLSQVSVDGILPNRRLNLAMGLASIHMAQYFETKWKAVKASKAGSHDKIIHSWRELFTIGVHYRQIASLDQPFLWVDSLPDYKSKDGYRSDVPFVRGSVSNSKVKPYFELAFKLAKTMLEHYSGEGAVQYPGLKEDIARAATCEDLLSVARRRQINPHGFLVSTQVPSMLRQQDDHRLDGGVLVLTEDISQRIVFALNIASTADRTASYSAEMDHLLTLLQDEIRKLSSNKVSDVEAIVSHILSIAYYFYNLIPLSKGSSAVAYSVMLGLLMSVGRQITGRIPHGRLLDMEAMLAGAPEAFVMVARNWMAVKKCSVPVSSLPRVWEVLPTVRSVLEVLAANTTLCPH
ncbi:tetratricopeptide repeat protein 13 [Aplysia californica]|uniref:Tetratricopeptide repeat protein 13 n=1 Tax=Aplysia californica TaxID=6500 RepID=A0ABM0K4X5_APLCA|nr:tetratricopeptide repeat protein 13 [Aplysia californica]